VAHPEDDLTGWIATLRVRLAHGDLDGCGTIAVAGVTLPVAHAARLMLGDLDHQAGLSAERRGEPLVMAHRLRLLADLWELRAQIG
jgi:hypothetical protein